MQNAFHVNVKRWVVAAAQGRENEKIYVREATCKERISGGDDADFGMMGHWNAEGGRKFATGVIPHVEEIMKWPVKNDQIALKAPPQKTM